MVHDKKVDALPHLIYVAREKCPKVSHPYKAGAMNVMVSRFLLFIFLELIYKVSGINFD